MTRLVTLGNHGLSLHQVRKYGPTFTSSKTLSNKEFHQGK